MLLGLIVPVVLLHAACTTEKIGVQPADGGGLKRDAGGAKQDGAFVRPDVSTTCTPPAVKRELGQACECSLECASGFCVDGVCCDTGCTDNCRACNIATNRGKCSPVPAGTPPVDPSQCKKEPVESCGFDGTCDGSGACRKYPENTVCGAGKCEGASVVGTKVCSGGQCKTGPSTICSPFACDPASNSCVKTCANNGQCDGRTCAGGSCGKKPLGAACGGAAECDSGFCADGVCCNVACNGACVSCNQEGKMGQCAAVAAGTEDPHGKCMKEDPSTCRQSGLCNGQGGCAKYAAGTVCKSAACSGGSQVPASTCDGNGSCLVGAPINCFPYVCSNNACKASCGTTTDCATGNTCTQGSCGKKGLGQKCSGTAECKSGFCVDGVCCDNACGKSCQYCAFPNSPGRCVNVQVNVEDPRKKCADKGAASCQTNGKCDGAGACQFYSTGTVCKAESCDANTNRYTGEGVCRNKMCVSPSATTCAPFKCNANRCGTSCNSNTQCASPAVCDPTGSCGKKPIGAVCAMNTECTSGFCAQGVCCSTACTASCFSCALAGSAGTCTAVAAGGVDPAGSCKDDGPSSCGNDGTCNGSGGCRKYAAGTICAAAACSGGTYTGASTCNGTGACNTGSPRACTPFVCNSSGTDCFSSCVDNTQCIPGRTCQMGTCGKKEVGATCLDKDECKSGFCVDGVCCSGACTGVCRSCNLTTPGTCENIAAGSPDPQADSCPVSAESTCGFDGTCNGMGDCRKWGTSTMCAGATCTGATLKQAAYCNGAGTCTTPATQSCGTFKCDETANACRTSCSTSAECVSGNVCSEMSCGKKPLGASCTTGDECAMGHCVDNTCCSTSACGTCQTCANGAGVCADVPKDMPDSDTCTDNTSNDKCSTVGLCNGNGVCRFAGNNVSCGSACTGDKSGVVAKTCSGSGACTGEGMTTSCQGYECVNGACANTCDPVNGPGCTGGNVCIDNHCVDPPLPEPPAPLPDAGAGEDAPSAGI